MRKQEKEQHLVVMKLDIIWGCGIGLRALSRDQVAFHVCGSSSLCTGAEHCCSKLVLIPGWFLLPAASKGRQKHLLLGDKLKSLLEFRE